MQDFIIFMLAAYLPMNIIMILSPFLAKRSIRFGVAIPEPYLKDTSLEAARKNYLQWSVVVSIAGLILYIALQPWLGDIRFAIALLTAIFFSLLGHSFLYVRSYYRVKKLKADKGWEVQTPPGQKIVVDMSFHKQKKRYSNLWFLLHFAIVAGTAIYLTVIYDSIPERMATHYDLQGVADGFSTKSFITVFDLSIIQLVMIGMFMGINWLIDVTKQQIDPANPEASRRNSVHFRRLSSLLMISMGLLIVALFSLLKLASVLEASSRFIGAGTTSFMIVLFVTVAVFIVLMIRAKRTTFAEETAVLPMDADQHWKLGVIYYNKSDPSLFVEKRQGIGYTVNMGSPLSWLIVIGLLLFAGLIIYFSSFASN
ncbi:DUF1648 domain-containing protein [Paenibacillus radicis (ex Gao et al. 2016)]|uniref:Membrane protein n=1 Tax=Paenibacillus radicis (ex Gao et al. 2016) TaxID=1737354 RepID=A0A917HK47_9BACL|nr:DUF1648 domain-containing protein [Paenibacillus radicis (ex Gao et al. 2016)]GGG81270.1 membrane protein [Paenibacillus radicis (ex Gao et al. 2016)]